MTEPGTFLRCLLDAAIAAADPAIAVPPHLPEPPPTGGGRVIVVGGGKAAAAMARAVERSWPNVALSGAVVTRHGSALPTERIAILEARHPEPDEASQRAGERMLAEAQASRAEDLVLALMSGGASSLLALPAQGLTLDDKLSVNRALLRSGATITEMNCVRRHLSAIKGGRLAAAAHPATVVTLAISDVPGDDPATIGSGPTVADPSTFEQARDIAAKHALDLPPRAMAHLAAGADETPKPGDPVLANTSFRLIATPQMALDAAARLARAEGLDVVMLGDALEGEARDVAVAHAALAREAAPGTLFLSGGELTVTMKGAGKGGPNTEYALAMAAALDGAPGIHVLAADTDGIDGSGDNAGALVTPDTLHRARSRGEDATARLEANDSYPFFSAIGDLVITGAQQTNVNDFRAVLVLG